MAIGAQSSARGFTLRDMVELVAASGYGELATQLSVTLEKVSIWIGTHGDKLIDAIRDLTDSPLKPGYEEYFSEIKLKLVEAKLLAQAIRYYGKAWIDERKEEKNTASLIKAAARGRASELECQQLYEKLNFGLSYITATSAEMRGDSDNDGVAKLRIQTAAARCSELKQELWRYLNGVSSKAAVQKAALNLKPFVRESRGRLPNEQTAAHVMFIFYARKIGDTSRYTWDGIAEIGRDRKTRATADEFSDEGFRPQPVFKICQALGML